MSEAWIDQDQLKALATVTGGLRAPDALYQWMAPRSLVDDESYLRADFLASSICHSTQGGLRGYFDGRFYKGWDYLWRSFLAAAEAGLLSWDKCKAWSADSLEYVLRCAADRGEVHLADLDRRAEIIRELAHRLAREENSSVRGVLGIEHRQVYAGGVSGLYARLSNFEAFQDPQHKKSTCFIMTGHFSRRFVVVDPDVVDPMVDYHRIRILLRLGVLRVESSLSTRLQQRQLIPSATAHSLRSLAYRSSRLIAEQSRAGALELDVTLWAFARSGCRDEPVCVSGAFQNESFSQMTGVSDATRCIFDRVCLGRRDAAIRGLWEPETRSEDY